MKLVKTITSIFLVVTFGAVLNAKPKPSLRTKKDTQEVANRAAIEREIIRLEEQGLEVSKNNDIAGTRAMLADDCIIFRFDGRIFKKEELLEDMKQDPWHFDRSTQKLANSYYSIKVLGNTVIASFVTTLSGSAREQWLVTDVWIRKNGEWKLTHSQGTQVPIRRMIQPSK